MNNPRKQGYQSLNTPSPTYTSTSPAAAASKKPINKGKLSSSNTTSDDLLPKPLTPKRTGPEKGKVPIIPTGPPISMTPPKTEKKKQTKKKQTKKKKGGKNKTRRKKTRGKKKRHRRTKKY